MMDGTRLANRQLNSTPCPPPPPPFPIGNSNFKTASLSLYKKISEIEIEIRDRTSSRHGPLKETAQLQAAHKSIQTHRSQVNLTREKSFRF